MVYITHIRFSDGSGMQHIALVRWEQPGYGRQGVNTRAQMVDYLREGNDVFVRGRGNTPDAKVVIADANPPHLKTVADGRDSNDLLCLPVF